jgi:N-acetylmuramic acid 6-phosphate etherase
MTKAADMFVFIDAGPEIIAGSTRMKAGTAQKMVLNMISTATMIRLGMTYSNWMINVAMTNQKLRDRGIHILQEILGISRDQAERLADDAGGTLKVAVAMGALGCDRTEAERRLAEVKGNLRAVVGHMGGGRE